MKRKIFGLAFTFETVLTIVFFFVIFSFGVTIMNNILNNYRTDLIKNFCDSVDNALQAYARTHRAVKIDSLKISETPQHQELVKYEQGGVYPADLNELGLLESQFGYLSLSTPIVQASAWDKNYNAEVSTVKQSFIADKEHGGFEVTYTAKKINGNVMIYTLSAVLPNGTIYYSPHSEYSTQ